MPGRINVTKHRVDLGRIKLPAEVEEAIKNPPPPPRATEVHPTMSLHEEGPAPESAGPFPVSEGPY